MFPLLNQEKRAKNNVPDIEDVIFRMYRVQT